MYIFSIYITSAKIKIKKYNLKGNLFMEDLVSIVVPIYNVEEYLDSCINSIVNQTYKNIEIILVDDGSPDNSGSMCDLWQSRDSRIKVIHKENGGLSDARNVGISEATGKYISLVDSDDTITNDMIETLMFYQQKYNADIVQGMFKDFINEEDITINNEKPTCTVINKIDAIKNLYDKKYGLQSTVVWNKLYKAELFKELKFPKGKVHEDEFTVYKLYYKSSKIVLLNKVIYNYRKRPESIMSKGFNLNRFYWLEANEERIDFFDKNINDEELIEKAVEEYGNRVMEYHYLLNKHYKNDKKNSEILMEKAKNIRNRYNRCKNISKKNKIKFNTWFYFYPIIYNANKLRRKIYSKK